MMNNCQLIPLPKIRDPRGNLSFVENQNQINFDIQRVYYLYDVPGGSTRGGHAHKRLNQLVIAIAGSFDIHLDDGQSRKSFTLNSAHQGLYICPMIWRTIDNFSTGAVCLVLASDKYHENDYIRDYNEFIKRCASMEGVSQ